MKRGTPTQSGSIFFITAALVFTLLLTGLPAGAQEAPETDMQQESQNVYLKGLVKEPGEFPYIQNATLYDLLVNHSGLTDDEFRAQIALPMGEIVRTAEGDADPTVIIFDVDDVLAQVPGTNEPLQPQDMVRVYADRPGQMFDDVVYITGYVKQPGKYALTDGMTLADLIMEAGGFEPEAHLEEAEVTRIDLQGVPGDTLARTFAVDILNNITRPENPERALSQIYDRDTPASLFKLQPYDQVHIRKNPDIILPNNVFIEGEVLYPGTYTLERRGETLTELVDRAGGFTSGAFIPGGKLLRYVDMPGVEVEIDELRREMGQAREQVIMRERMIEKVFGNMDMSTVGAGVGFPLAEGPLAKENANLIRGYQNALSRYQNAKAAYEDALVMQRGQRRIAVDFAELFMDGKKHEDVVLIEGDRIIIPKHPGTVTVLGQVNNPGIYNHVKDKRMGYYIDIAGGKTSDASYAVVTQPTGYSIKQEWLNDPVVMEGAIIRVVPKGAYDY